MLSIFFNDDLTHFTVKSEGYWVVSQGLTEIIVLWDKESTGSPNHNVTDCLCRSFVRSLQILLSKLVQEWSQVLEQVTELGSSGFHKHALTWTSVTPALWLAWGVLGPVLLCVCDSQPVVKNASCHTHTQCTAERLVAPPPWL